MNNFRSILAIAVLIAFSSCSKDEQPTTAAASPSLQTFSNLYAPVIGGGGQPVSGDFVKFSFATNSIVTNENWDIAFRSTTILVNGGVATAGQPARTGIGAASIISSTFANVTSAPADNLFNQDNATVLAIPTGAGNGWYNYTQATNLITPIAGKVIVIKTHDGKFAKMEILNFYQNAPANPIGTEPSRYYKFNFVYQSNGTRIF